MKYFDLPVYQQKDKILSSLKDNQVIIVESPTGSGKTTQLPVILYMAGYSADGMIGMTQPRRIAALSVSDFISQQLEQVNYEPADLVACKMRFTDETTYNTRIKIMTDGILLQEMKTDALLQKYSLMIIDEAHERSLNIDFILGLLKRLLQKRPDFKVIISSATLNAQLFSRYYNDCVIVRIETHMFPVRVIYKPVINNDKDILLLQICSIVENHVCEKRAGDILIFLSGEFLIKQCVQRLQESAFCNNLFLVPLYGRLSREEQERVFDTAPLGKIKVVVSTNIAETSITIDGITCVIDSGLMKMNFFHVHTGISSLEEQEVSRAAADQRKGRAGRTQAGLCYRLYSRENFLQRVEFSIEEIYRTDLSEVVLRMADLGITDFMNFEFLSSPNKKNVIQTAQSLISLHALTDTYALTDIGAMMVKFPLSPRHARIIIEAMLHYIGVLDEVIIIVSFLSNNTPFLLPAGEEQEARRAHNMFAHEYGDFLTYVSLFRAYEQSSNKENFCTVYYLEPIIMHEITQVCMQLTDIVHEFGIIIDDKHTLTVNDTIKHVQCAMASGLVGFICIQGKRNTYSNLNTEYIDIHPGSVLFRNTPPFILAAELVRTSRMFARSVGKLEPEWIEQLNPGLIEKLQTKHNRQQKNKGVRSVKSVKNHEHATQKNRTSQGAAVSHKSSITLAGEQYAVHKLKGKTQLLIFTWDECIALYTRMPRIKDKKHARMKTRVLYQQYHIFDGERLSHVLRVVKHFSMPEHFCVINKPYRFSLTSSEEQIITGIQYIATFSPLRQTMHIGFNTLNYSKDGTYLVKPNRNFHYAIQESLQNLEIILDIMSDTQSSTLHAALNTCYGRLYALFEIL